VNSYYGMFEMHYDTENQPLSLAYQIVPSFELVQVLQMNILNMIPHMRNAFEGTSPLIV
jgi:hypothetical protein